MVLSSVSVAPVLADEEIVDFGVEYQSEDNASEEVANFGGDLVEEEANDGEDAGDDVSFSDEVIEDDTVVEDEYVENVADAGADLAFVEDEPVVAEDNASAEENLSDYINEMSLGESLDEQVADADADYATSVTVNSYIYGLNVAGDACVTGKKSNSDGYTTDAAWAAAPAGTYEYVLDPTKQTGTNALLTYKAQTGNTTGYVDYLISVSGLTVNVNPFELTV